uniref:Flagellar protein n=1 Tax=Desulfobacca acetoxidans TaxID=60893 RepID=A0A7V4G7R4_9BACT
MAGFLEWGEFLSSPGVAEIVSGAARGSTPDFPLWSHLLRVVAILSAMVGALFLTLALWKRWGPRTQRSPVLIQILATHYLAPKQTLMVVAVGRERFLLASSPNHLNLVPLAEREAEGAVPRGITVELDRAEKG